MTMKTIGRFVRHYGGRSKIPFNSLDSSDLPVFKYSKSKKYYKRVFTWGNIHTGALGIPHSNKNGSLSLTNSHNQKFPKRISFGERHEVTTAACGFGFSVFGVNSEDNLKVYGTGINTDSQIGSHKFSDKLLEILHEPVPIYLPFKYPEKSNILKLSAGRAHLLVLTDEGLFTLGNNAYGQCGRNIIPDENYVANNYVHHIERIDGRRIIDVECGQDHSLALLEDGSVYSCGWGADGQTGLDHYNCCSKFTKIKGDIENEKIIKMACRADFVLALNDKGEVFGWGNTEYGQLSNYEQQVATPRYVEFLRNLGIIRSVASGGSMCAVVNNDGHVFTWGYGLLGTGPSVTQCMKPIRIADNLFGRNDFQPDSRVTEVTCGLSHVGALNNKGDIFIWGRNKSCCLGLGNDKDQFFPLKVALGGLADKVFCGVDHTIALCKPFI